MAAAAAAPTSTPPSSTSAVLLPKNVLITGGCGFIGSNFINYIFDKWPTCRLINLDKLVTGASTKHILDKIRHSTRYFFVEGNLMDQQLVLQLLRHNQIDTVIHFAAITHVDESYSDRIGTIQENIISTTTLLEAINAYGSIRRMVHISTDEYCSYSPRDVVFIRRRYLRSRCHQEDLRCLWIGFRRISATFFLQSQPDFMSKELLACKNDGKK